MGCLQRLQITEAWKSCPQVRWLSNSGGLPLASQRSPHRQHCNERTVEVAPHVSEKIFVAIGRALIFPSIEHAALIANRGPGLDW